MPVWLPAIPTLPPAIEGRGVASLRRMQNFRQPTEIDKTRREAEEIHEIGRGRMQPNHLFRRNARVARDIRQDQVRTRRHNTPESSPPRQFSPPPRHPCSPALGRRLSVRHASSAEDRSQSARKRTPDAGSGFSDHACLESRETARPHAGLARARLHSPKTTSNDESLAGIIVIASRTFSARIADASFPGNRRLFQLSRGFVDILFEGARLQRLLKNANGISIIAKD